MKKKIAVICALPPERNTGMATVDLSAHRVLPRLLPDADFTLYTYGKMGQHAYQPGDLPYEHKDITDDPKAFFAADAFLYWGDFIHTRSYWQKDRGDWNTDASNAEKQKMLLDCADYMFLANLPEKELQKAVVFGSTIITNEAADVIDEAYRSHFLRFYEHIGHVFFRDALSAAKISPYRVDEPTLGSDCALLLEDDDLRALKGFAPAGNRHGVGIFFGRSSSKLTMLLFARSVAKELKQPYRWIPWFWTPMRLRMLAKLLGLPIARGFAQPGDILTQLSQCQFVVTDTYHLCVNAWRMGIPAICIGRGAGVSANSLSDKKKEIFCEMYGARRFYVFLETLGLLNNGNMAKRAAGTLSNAELCAQVVSTIQNHRKTASVRLKSALEKALSYAA